MKSQTGLKMGHVGSKTRSLGQIFEKPCVRSGGHIFSPIVMIFSPIVMKHGQNVCLDGISDESQNGSYGVKTRSLGQILEKSCVRSGGQIFSQIIM